LAYLARGSTGPSSIKLVSISVVMVISVSSVSMITKFIEASPSVIAFWRTFIALSITVTYYLVFDWSMFCELGSGGKYVIAASIASRVFRC